MLNVCKQYSNSQEEAKDLLQEGFIKVFKNIAQYDGVGSFEGWIRRIMVNNAITQFNKNAKSITQYIDKEDFADDSYADIDVEYKPEIEHHQLLALIHELPPVYKIVFNLNIIEGHSHKIIAEMLNISEATSRSNLSKARAKLKDRINQLYYKNSLCHV